VLRKNTLGIKECATAHAIENPSSGRVLEKLGFKYEKEVPYVYSMGELETTGKYYSWTAVSA
jgi:ribosomal-protein-alanine N-acetyltransferase